MSVKAVELIDGVAIEGSDLQMIVAMVEKQRKLAIEVATMEETLESKKAEYKRWSEELIPEKMMELGLESLSLKDGASVTIEKFYAAHITKENAAEAYAWLRKNKHDGIIKTEVIVMCKKGEQERAKLAEKALKAAKIPFEKRDSVHHATLKAFVRELMENGEKIPTDLFGVYVGNKTKIQEPAA